MKAPKSSKFVNLVFVSMFLFLTTKAMFCCFGRPKEEPEKKVNVVCDGRDPLNPDYLNDFPSFHKGQF